MMLNKNVDLFKADRAMSERVADFMQKKVWNIALGVHYKAEIETTEKTIEGLRKLDGSILGKGAEEQIQTLEAHIVALKAERDKRKAEEGTFSFTEADNKLYKAYEKATTEAMTYNAIVEWFNGYNLDVDGTTFIKSIMDALKGKNPDANKNIILSGATVFNAEKRKKTNFLKVFYGELAEAMLKAGTLKPTAIPEEVREYYMPKKESKKNKKAKKAEQNA